MGPKAMHGTRQAARMRCGWLLALAAAGCSSTRLEPGYNQNCPTGGEPTVLRRVEMAADAAGDALDNFDQRVENEVW